MEGQAHQHERRKVPMRHEEKRHNRNQKEPPPRAGLANNSQRIIAMFVTHLRRCLEPVARYKDLGRRSVF